MAYKRKDAFYERAKQAGYRSRAAYKLAELDDRYRLMRRGDRVLDLGAWPGGWLQVAAARCGREGTIIGVDTATIDPLGLVNVRTIAASVLDPAFERHLAAVAPDRFDVLLSDLAPKLTGVRATDEARARELAEAALTVAERILRPGGRMLMKLFMGEETRPIVERARARFRTVKLTKPEATRRGSMEMYLIALEHRAPQSDGAS